jgi:hypothetical protein
VKALLSLALALAAQAALADTVVVRAGKLVDVDNEKVLADQAVVIVDGKVASVEKWGQIPF